MDHIMSDREIETLNRKVDKILFYMNNDSETGKKGIVAELENLSADFYNFLEKYKRDVAVKNAKTGLIAGIVSGLVTAAAWIIKLFI